MINANEIMDIMLTIDYGFKDDAGKNIIDNPNKWDSEFANFYYLLTPDELLDKRCGVCWDQVELERSLFEERGVFVKTYFICSHNDGNDPSHTFLVFSENNKYYWFENSWGIYRGIYEYKSLDNLLIDVKKKFISSNNIDQNAYTFVYEYNKPKYHLSCMEFYKYCENGEAIKLNKPLYFYHLIDKKVDLGSGLISLKYMYNHEMFDLFDKNVSKYKKRIIDDWNIEKYNDKSDLSREEYIDALNIFRGPYGASYIFFFKYPPYKGLGSKMAELLKVKDIYKININDESIQKHILDIFYGNDMSDSDNNLLNKKYYENVTDSEYFKNYDDSLEMNFKTLKYWNSF